MFRKAAPIAARPEAFFEELFLQRYDQLLEWALHLTDHRAAQSEDLVHDAFVQLTLSPPDFKTIENLDGYLFVVLRNLHRSQMQRSQRGPLGPEALVDFDSAVAGLKAQDPRQHWQAIEELQLVCRFACVRKESSKAGSALILRFFHGYYPGEVAALLCVSRPAIKELLRMARGEAKLFLDDPTKLSFLSETPNKSVPDIKPGATSEETLAHLRQSIFAARQGRCLERKHLAEIYEAAQPALLTVPLLAHLVSCPDCLDEANRLLGLPSLSERDPNDMLGPDRGAQSGSGTPTVTPFAAASKTRARPRMLKKYRQRLREVYEHEPQELRIAVNGFVLARQEITAAVHKQTLGIEVAKDLSLIEVLSEQGHRLLALHVEPPPDGSFEQQARAEFSEGRTLTARLSFCGSWPHLEIIYDSGLQMADGGLEERSASPPVLFSAYDDSLAPSQGLLERLKFAIRNPQSATFWLLRPITITILLTTFLIAVVVGQKLGWWFAPNSPKPAPRVTSSGKPAPASLPTVSPALAPSAREGAVPIAPDNPTATAPAPVTNAATAAMEIEALRLLQQAGADLGEQVEVKRNAQGQLLIEGVVEAEPRKAELQRALAPLLAYPAVQFRIETVTEALARQRTASGSKPVNSAPLAAGRIEVEKVALPIAEDLRAYLQTRSSAATEAEIHALAARLHTQARRASDHLYALKRLTKQLPPAQYDLLERGAQTKFLGLLRQHAQGYMTKTQRLREDLAAVLRVTATAPKTSSTIHDAADLYRAITQLGALGQAATLVLDQSLTITNQPLSATNIKSSTFWRTLNEAENIASQIERYASQQIEKEP